MTFRGDVAVTAAEAADQVGVARATIDSWVYRGQLAAIDPDGRPRRYWLSDVFAAEAARKRTMRRTRGTFAPETPP